MDEHSKNSHENGYIESLSSDELLGFDPSSNTKLRSLLYVLKCFLLKLILHGADEVIKDRRAMKTRLALANGLVSGSRVSEGNNEFEDQNIEVDKMEFAKSGNTFDFSSKNKSNNNNNIHFPMNFLTFIVVLMMKVLGFQFSLFLSVLTFPIWSSYFLFMFVFFPFRTLNRVKGYLMKKVLRVCSVTFTTVTSSVSKRAQAQKLKAVRVGFPFFTSIYACFMLVGLLALGFLVGGFMVQHLIIERPIQIQESLNFDYSKSSPVAFVPLKDIIAGDETQNMGRVVPHNHKLHVSVQLIVPESEYNQRLGVFQVRVDFLSEHGKVLATSRHPCMLRFKSGPVRFVETLLKSVPLIAGFQSESQILDIKMTEITEGIEPTTCLRTVLEQRAEFQSGEGVPQIYEASLLLESELPKLKKFIWLWRRTIFVWSSIMVFFIMLIFILAFVRPFLFPIRPVKAGNLGKNKMVIWS